MVDWNNAIFVGRRNQRLPHISRSAPRPAMFANQMNSRSRIEFFNLKQLLVFPISASACTTLRCALLTNCCSRMCSGPRNRGFREAQRGESPESPACSALCALTQNAQRQARLARARCHPLSSSPSSTQTYIGRKAKISDGRRPCDQAAPCQRLEPCTKNATQGNLTSQ